MKKILIIIFIIFLGSFFNKAYCGIVVQSTGGTTITPAQISTPISVNITTLVSLTLTLKVKALQQYITNTTNSSYKIPVSQLYLNDGTNSFQMQYNTSVTTIDRLAIGILGYTQNYNCIVTGIGVLPPGTYTTQLQFDSNTLLSPASTTYTLSFTIPLSQTVSTVTNPVNITLTPTNVFDSAAVVNNTTSPQVNLQSNSSWKLVLNTNGIGTLKGQYYYQIISVSPHVTNYSTQRIQIQANQDYDIAEGVATVTAPVTGTYTNDYVTIQYSLQNNTGAYIPEGTYTNNVTYSLQQNN